ncbi:Viral a-type inclusion protein [Neofusicoccum parvum]|uniref:Viral a-type inclusion protein n=1 Tax=Neofusicoccum parvum TaxID=310453 RepID=A0ACB5SDC4_9PEZI|nr:Viral a-type inclusion protein [Neofusicoccum parvum]
MESHEESDAVELQQALRTAECELELERSQRIVESVGKDEEVRKLRFQVLLLEDENDELQDQLQEEEQRSDKLETALDDALAQLRETEAATQRLSNELRMKTREAENMKVRLPLPIDPPPLTLAQTELASMETISTDSNKILTEKLALSRELSSLKPELEHLRSQVAAQEGLISEKLSLQRQLNTLEVELENEKRAAQRALARSEKQIERDTDHQNQINDLEKQLATERREREKAEKESQRAQRDVEAEKKAVERAQTKEQKKAAQEAKESAKVDDLKKELAKEKREAEDLKKEMAKEKREREKIEKAIQKTQMDNEAQVSLATERAEAYKVKLKATKEKLKEIQAELQKAQSATAAAKPSTEEIPRMSRNTRKRVAQLDLDATTLGTPGDGPAAKRSRTVAAPGDKSTFSITPFLNRTASVAPSSPIQEAHEEEEGEHEGDKTEDVVEAQPTPTAKGKNAKKEPAPKAKPLASVSTNKSSGKKAASKRQKAAVPSLEQVAEEGSEEEEEERENTPPTPKPAKQKENEKPAASKAKNLTTVATSLKPKLKPTSNQPRKSLASFPNFIDDDEPAKKKTRKLGGGEKSVLGKPTLFDMEDEDARPAKPIPGRGLFAARALNKSMGLKGGAKNGTLTTADGFTFSPLKKEKRAMREASYMA